MHDDHVETMRRQFKNILFEHIYSIQPIGRLTDMSNDLFLVEKAEYNILNMLSSIKKNFNSKIIDKNVVVESSFQIDSHQDKMKEKEVKKDTSIENKPNILTNKVSIEIAFC